MHYIVHRAMEIFDVDFSRTAQPDFLRASLKTIRKYFDFKREDDLDSMYDALDSLRETWIHKRKLKLTNQGLLRQWCGEGEQADNPLVSVCRKLTSASPNSAACERGFAVQRRMQACLGDDLSADTVNARLCLLKNAVSHGMQNEHGECIFVGKDGFPHEVLEDAAKRWVFKSQVFSQTKRTQSQLNKDSFNKANKDAPSSPQEPSSKKPRKDKDSTHKPAVSKLQTNELEANRLSEKSLQNLGNELDELASKAGVPFTKEDAVDLTFCQDIAELELQENLDKVMRRPRKILWNVKDAQKRLEHLKKGKEMVPKVVAAEAPETENSTEENAAEPEKDVSRNAAAIAAFDKSVEEWLAVDEDADHA